MRLIDVYKRQAICALHEVGIQAYGDIVLNHKMGADANEFVKAYEVNQNNKNEVASGEETIEVPTVFTFPKRQQVYSDFTWNWTCFDGIDYDILSKRHATFLFKDKHWDTQVDGENGNFDYLMGADIDFSNPHVVAELEDWAQWYLEVTGLDGFRLDAVKHIGAHFYKDLIRQLRQHYQKELFTVGEYWHGDVRRLCNYLNEVEGEVSLFAVSYTHLDVYKRQGYELAKRLKAFDCHIIGVKRTLSPLPPCIDELYTTSHIDEVLPQADFVILALPQTRETIHMFDKKRLFLMKGDAVLINIGRGSAICTNDLIEVLETGHLYGVGLDVVEEEPLNQEHDLWDLKKMCIRDSNKDIRKGLC